MLFVAIEKFAVETGLCAFDEHIPFKYGVLGINFDFEFFQFLKWKSQGLFEAGDNDHWMHSFLDVVFGLFEQFAGEEGNRGCSISHFIILE